MSKHTPLYDLHVSLGGKMVEYAGYELPVQYSSIITEHLAVREKAGLFDVSHMGEFFIEGKGALAFADYLLCNAMSDLEPGMVRYSPLLNRQGGIVDDLLVYCFSASKILLVVNAANRAKDWEWIKALVPGSLRLTDRSDDYCQIALQGPEAPAILGRLSPELPDKYYTFRFPVKILDCAAIVSRTGYTGEDGFEIYVPAKDGPAVFSALLEAGKDDGLVPCGLGSRDTLRLEAGMPLYGHEMTDEITPLETGLKYFVHLEKPDFVGKKALAARGEPARKRIGLKVSDRGIVREEAPVYLGSRKIGMTASGSYLPYLRGAYATAIVEKGSVKAGDHVKAESRGHLLDCEVVKLPFYSRKKGDK